MLVLDALLLLVFAVLMTGGVAWLVILEPSLWSIPAVVVGWYLADLLSGVVHFLLDYLPCPEGQGLDRLFQYTGGSRGKEPYLSMRREVMAGVGPWGRILFDFKCHHPRPHVLGRRTLVVLIRPALIFGGIPSALALNVACALLPVPFWLVAGLIALIFGSVLSQYFHGTVHRGKNPWFIAPLRRARVLIRPEAHAVHHRTLDRDFATVNGWSNPVVNRIFAWCRGRGWLADEGLEPR
jgi:hypothetical protein